METLRWWAHTGTKARLAGVCGDGSAGSGCIRRAEEWLDRRAQGDGNDGRWAHARDGTKGARVRLRDSGVPLPRGDPCHADLVSNRPIDVLANGTVGAREAMSQSSHDFLDMVSKS